MFDMFEKNRKFKDFTKMMTSYQIKEKQKILLDYSQVIADTDNDLLTLNLSKYAIRVHRELIQDTIYRSRELRQELISYGLFRIGNIFTDFEAKFIHTDYGYVRYEGNLII